MQLLKREKNSIHIQLNFKIFENIVETSKKISSEVDLSCDFFVQILFLSGPQIFFLGLKL